MTENKIPEFEDYRDAENGEILDALEEHGLKALDDKGFRIIRGQKRGRSAEGAYWPNLKPDEVVWALGKYKKYHAKNDKQKAELDKLIEHYQNKANTKQRSSGAPKINDEVNLSIGWKSTNPQNTAAGRWRPFIIVPLDPYKDSLKIERNVKPGEKEGDKEILLPTGAISAKFENGKIVLDTSALITKMKKAEEDDEEEE